MTDETTGQEEAPQRQPQSGPARMMSERMSIYYSNCAMVATSPRDISLFFGRYVPGSNAKGEQSMVELYEQQIYMTLGQAEDLVRILTQTLEATKARMKAGSSSQP
jgi:Protein of unknown function (DUF3467)